MPVQKSPAQIAAALGLATYRVFDFYRQNVGNKGAADYGSPGTGHGWLGSTKSAFIANGYLSLPGTGGNDATAPDSAALSVTGSFEIVTRIFNSAPAAFGMLMGKDAVTGGGAGSRSFAFYVDNSGKLGVALSTDGSAASTVLSSVAPSAAAGVTYWAKVTRDSVTGNVIFYTAADQSTEPSSWTQLGTTQVGPTGALFDSTQLLRIGNGGNGTSLLFSGGVYRSILRSSIGGTIVFDANFAAQAVGTTLFLESSSNAAAVTINSSAADTNDPVFEGARLHGTEGLKLPGVVGNFASATAAASVKIATDLDIRAKIQPLTYAVTTTTRIVTRENPVADRSYGLSLEASGILSLFVTIDGTTLIVATSTANLQSVVSDGTPIYVRGTFDADNGSAGKAFKFYTSPNGTTWTQLGTTVTIAGVVVTVWPGSSPVEIGSRVGGTANNFAGRIYSVQIRNNILDDGTGIVFNADFSTQTAGAASFTESSANAATVTITSTNTVPGLTFATDDYVQSPAAADLVYGAAMTFFDVVKLAVPGATACLASQFDTNAARSWGVFVTTAGKLQVIISADGGAANVKDYTSSRIVADGTWHSVGFTLINGVLTLYIDGTPDGSPTKTTDATVTSLFNSSANLMIGASLATGAAANNLTGSEAAIVLYPTGLSTPDFAAGHNYYASTLLAADGISLPPAVDNSLPAYAAFPGLGLLVG